MKPTTVPTAPFLYNYKIWDTKKNEYVYTCTHRKDVYHTHTNFFNEWVYKEVSVLRNRYSRFYDSAAPNTRKERDYRRYTIYDHFHNEVDYRDLHAQYGTTYRNGRYLNDYTVKKPDVRYKAGNPNKIKRGYHNGSWWDDSAGRPYESEYVTYSYHRNFHIMPERRRAAADVADYGAEIVRARRRCSNLPDPWDDYDNSASHSINSWKTHSKRRKQWKPKP